ISNALRKGIMAVDSLKLIRPMVIMLGRRVDEVQDVVPERNFEIERRPVSPTSSSASTEVPDNYEPGDLKSLEWPIPGYCKKGRKLKRRLKKPLTTKVKNIKRRYRTNCVTGKRKGKHTPTRKVLFNSVPVPSTSSPITKTNTPISQVPKGKVSPLVPRMYFSAAEVITKLHPLCADSVGEMSQGKREALFGKGPSVPELVSGRVSVTSSGSSLTGGKNTSVLVKKIQGVKEVLTLENSQIIVKSQHLPSVEVSVRPQSQPSCSSFNEWRNGICQPTSTWPLKSNCKEIAVFTSDTIPAVNLQEETPLNLSLDVANNSFQSFEPSTTRNEIWRHNSITSGRETSLLTRKVPTVKRSEASIYTKNQTYNRNGRNSNKNSEPGPTVKVVNGKSIFMRGGEEVVVDANPKLGVPKDKPKYDDNVPWICSFCHLHTLAQINLPLQRNGLSPHPYTMGDLFGPYTADLPPIHGESTSSSKRETWMHGDCALWAGRLLLVRDTLLGLEETLVNADTEVCTVCNKTGATISCLQRKCGEGVHFPCAKWKGWQLDVKNFRAYCPKHCWNPIFK
ncbi:hypothetical protein Ocin01_11893, partial [Orchesella cincta]